MSLRKEEEVVLCTPRAPALMSAINPDLVHAAPVTFHRKISRADTRIPNSSVVTNHEFFMYLPIEART